MTIGIYPSIGFDTISTEKKTTCWFCKEIIQPEPSPDHTVIHLPGHRLGYSSHFECIAQFVWTLAAYVTEYAPPPREAIH